MRMSGCVISTCGVVRYADLYFKVVYVEELDKGKDAEAGRPKLEVDEKVHD